MVTWLASASRPSVQSSTRARTTPYTPRHLRTQHDAHVRQTTLKRLRASCVVAAALIAHTTGIIAGSATLGRPPVQNSRAPSSSRRFESRGSNAHMHTLYLGYLALACAVSRHRLCCRDSYPLRHDCRRCPEMHALQLFRFAQSSAPNTCRTAFHTSQISRVLWILHVSCVRVVYTWRAEAIESFCTLYAVVVDRSSYVGIPLASSHRSQRQQGTTTAGYHDPLSPSRMHSA